MMKDYGVRVLSAYEFKRVGQIIFPPGVERERLIRGGLVEAVKPSDDGLVEKARQTFALGKKK